MAEAREPTRNPTQELLARVRAAIGPRPAGASAAAPEVDDALVRLCSREEDLVARFTQKAQSEAVRMSVHPTTPSQLAQAVREAVSISGERKPVVAVSVIDPADRLACERAVGDLIHTRGAANGKTRLDALYDVDVGITDVEAAIAESGTLVVRSDAKRSRGTFLVPSIHVALVRASQILPDLLDFWQFAASRGPTTSRVFITGPSKTADIEGILVTGVHGPKEVRIVLVDDRG